MTARPLQQAQAVMAAAGAIPFTSTVPDQALFEKVLAREKILQDTPEYKGICERLATKAITPEQALTERRALAKKLHASGAFGA